MYCLLLTVYKTDILGASCDKRLIVLEINVNFHIVEIYQNQTLLSAFNRLLTQHLYGKGLHACGRACYCVSRASTPRGAYAFRILDSGVRAAQYQRRTHSCLDIDLEITEL